MRRREGTRKAAVASSARGNADVKYLKEVGGIVTAGGELDGVTTERAERLGREEWEERTG